MRGDDAVSDFVATLLLVALVVVMGSVLAVTVASTLEAPAAPPVRFALASVSPGDGAVALVLRDGAPLPLADLRLRLERAGGASDVPQSAWSTPDPATLRPGERLSFALSPPAAEGEVLRVRVAHAPANALLASLEARAGAAAAVLGTPTLNASFQPNRTVADGATAARLVVNVSHPAGALAVARVVADLSNLTNASGSAASTLLLADSGAEGDLVGGDGAWSGLVTLSSLTPVGLYNVTVNATDVTGSVVATAVARLNVTANGTGGQGGVGVGGDVTGGRCLGCIVQGGVSSYEGTRLTVPTSANLTSFRLRNWTWDRLHPERLVEDAMAIRVVNGSSAWSAYFTFDYVAGVPGIKSVVVWNKDNETTYAPRNGTLLPLSGLDLNMTDPVGELQLVHSAGNAHPNSLYHRADMRNETTFIIAYMRDEDVTGTRPEALDIGIFSVDVVIA